MGLGDYVEGRISTGIARGVDESLPKLRGVFDDTIAKSRTHVDDIVLRVEERSEKFLDGIQGRLRVAADTFFTDLERRWEKRLETETRAQFKLLNRVLVYTLAVALLSLGYAVARTKLGW